MILWHWYDTLSHTFGMTVARCLEYAEHGCHIARLVRYLSFGRVF